MVGNALIEILPGKLYFASFHAIPPSDERNCFCTIHRAVAYKPFFADFGPLNLAELHKYTAILLERLQKEDRSGVRLVEVSSHDVKERANVAFLLCAFLVIHKGYSARDAALPFEDRYPPLTAFRDASYGISSFDLTLLDCLEGLSKALQFEWYSPACFDAETYQKWAETCNGGMNWLIPGKLLAFIGPTSKKGSNDKQHRCAPSDYVKLFKELGILLVIRLNSNEYDSSDFTREGIRHADLQFPDGSCPSPDIMERFLALVHNQSGPVAVHCRAGLGRTGVLAGLYAMRHYSISARAVIGWFRVARPGSLLGPQQQFLCDMQEQMRARRISGNSSGKLRVRSTKKKGVSEELLNQIPTPLRPQSKVRFDLQKEDSGQGEWLSASLEFGPQEREKVHQPSFLDRFMSFLDKDS